MSKVFPISSYQFREEKGKIARRLGELLPSFSGVGYINTLIEEKIISSEIGRSDDDLDKAAYIAASAYILRGRCNWSFEEIRDCINELTESTGTAKLLLLWCKKRKNIGKINHYNKIRKYFPIYCTDAEDCSCLNALFTEVQP
mgnify:CR=1 FL=1